MISPRSYPSGALRASDREEQEPEVAEGDPVGPDPQPYVDQIEKYADAGYDHVYLHQVGPDQQGFPPLLCGGSGAERVGGQGSSEIGTVTVLIGSPLSAESS